MGIYIILFVLSANSKLIMFLVGSLILYIDHDLTPNLFPISTHWKIQIGLQRLRK